MAASVRSRFKMSPASRLLALAVALMFALCLAGCDDEDTAPTPSGTSPSGTPQATGMLEESARASRVINIVYDDSGSMNSDTAWCQARYALEVFAAMLDENDTMKVFTMSSAHNAKEDAKGKLSPDVVISGKESMEARVAKVHEDFSKASSWTDFGAALSAYADLSQSAEKEKWLVILTDGQFTDVNEYREVSENDEERSPVVASLVNGYLAKWAGEGIHVEYVCMRQSVPDWSLPDSGGNLSVRKTSPDNILKSVIEECNKIYDRTVLPQSSYSASSQQLELGIPMKKIIVFAQGKGVSIGNLEAGGMTEDTSSAHVKYVDAPYKGYRDTDGNHPAPVNEELQGQVSVFKGRYQQGTAKLAVGKDADVEIYYEPYVDIHMVMNASDGSQIVLSQGTKGELTPGTYTATFSLYDPFTKEPISSELIWDQQYETKLTYPDGREVKIPAGGTITIDEGEAQIAANAVINKEVPYTQNYQVDIISRSMGIEILRKPAEPVDVHVLDSSDPIVVRVNRQDGTPLSADEMAQTALEVTTSSASEPQGLLGWLFDMPRGLDYTVEATSEPGVFNIYLQTHNGEPAETVDGDVPLHIRATRDAGFGGYSSLGETDTTLKITGVSLLEHIIHWLLTHWLQLLLLILLALLIVFIIMQVKKPRIPRNLAPRIIGIENEDELNLTYSRKSIKHAIWPPWAPETAHFKVSIRGDGVDAYEMARRFQLGGRKIGIVATKTKRGRAAVKLSENAVATMRQQLDAYDAGNYAGQFPHPGYDGYEGVFSHGGGGFTIQGFKPHRRRGWTAPEETTYEVMF